jgi:beta propeller repeat protein
MKTSRSPSALEAMREAARLLAVCTVTLAVLLWLTGAWADTLQVTEHQITSASTYETMPRLGNDGTSDLVVYTVNPVMPSGTFRPGSIWYQRLVDGAPSGDPVQVTDDPYDNELNDVSGDVIVYTAYNSTTSSVGRIMAYWISTGASAIVGSAIIIQEPRIYGTIVVWRQDAAGATRIMMYDLNWLGTGGNPIVLAGPIPPTYAVDIGDRFVVWAQDGVASRDIALFDFLAGVTYSITSTPTTNEAEPSTDGSWIVWSAQEVGSSASRIEARNMDTNEARTLVDNGAGNYRPSISGDLVAYESNLAGNLDIFVYRLSTGENFQVTTDPADQYLNDVFGDDVAYADTRNGNVDIYVSHLVFVPPVPSAEQLISNLITTVNSLDLKQGITTSLDAKLQAAEAALVAARKNDRTTACNTMNAFINDVSAQSGKMITLEQANQLIAATMQIKSLLGCP